MFKLKRWETICLHANTVEKLRDSSKVVCNGLKGFKKVFVVANDIFTVPTPDIVRNCFYCVRNQQALEVPENGVV
jgi:hypothetical protein